jgi:hypothetical protein
MAIEFPILKTMKCGIFQPCLMTGGHFQHPVTTDNHYFYGQLWVFGDGRTGSVGFILVKQL